MQKQCPQLIGSSVHTAIKRCITPLTLATAKIAPSLKLDKSGAEPTRILVN